MARGAFGDQGGGAVPQLRAHGAALFDKAVTCYERERFFERG